MTYCKGGNPNLKYTFAHLQKKKRKRFYIEIKTFHEKEGSSNLVAIII